MNDIAAVIFDMDGLLLATEEIARSAWLQAGKEWGYDIPEEVYVQVLGRTVPDSERIFRKAFGEDFPFREIRERRLQIAREFHQQHGYPLKKGVLPLLETLENLSIPAAVATSTIAEAARHRLTANRLLERFRVIVSGDQVENGKPAPDIFLLAAEKLQVPPPNCLVLEDSEAGILAAHRAGMPTIMVPDIKPPEDSIRHLAYRVMDSLEDVDHWIKRHPHLFESSSHQ